MPAAEARPPITPSPLPGGQAIAPTLARLDAGLSRATPKHSFGADLAKQLLSSEVRFLAKKRTRQSPKTRPRV